MPNKSANSSAHLVKVCHTMNYEVNAIRSFPSNVYYASQVVICILNTAITILTILLNLVTIVTFHSSSQLKKKTYHFLIYVQSAVDVTIGFTVSPLFSVIIASEVMGRPSCDALYAFYLLFYTMSGFSVAVLSAMNIERFTSIVYPVYHRNKVTKKKLLVYITCVCALFSCVSCASVALGQKLLVKFTGYSFLLQFVATVFIHTKIFLCFQAQVKRSNDRSENMAGSLPNPQEGGPVQQVDNGNRDNRSDNQSNRSDNQDNPSNNQGTRSDNQGTVSNPKEIGSDNHNIKRSGNQCIRQDHHDNRSDNQCPRSDNHGGMASQQNEGADPSIQNSSDRKSEQEFLMKFKVAKSCLIAVTCSLFAFFIPTVFQPMQLGEFDELILDSWFTVLVLLNPTLDSLIFFWRNKMLRNEAKKVLKKIVC